MLSLPQNFVLLGDSRWSRVRLAGLEPDEAGALMLARIPGLLGSAAVDLDAPFDPALLAFTVGPCAEVILAAPTGHAITLIDPRCVDRRLTIGTSAACEGTFAFEKIAGLAAGRDRLYVADLDAGAIALLMLPGLERRATWRGRTEAPSRLAIDGEERLYVLDRARPQLLRLDPRGRRDPSYTVTTAALADALDLAVTQAGAAFVSVPDQSRILRFSPDGTVLSAVAAPQAAPGLVPGALAVDAEHLYVADRASGALWVYAITAGRWLAPVPGFRGPVFGLATDGDGRLYIRTAAEGAPAYLRLDARTAHVGRGWLEAGPLDAGAAAEWMRVHADAEWPAGTRVQVETALVGMPDDGLSAVATPTQWARAAATDALVHAPGPAHRPADPEARLLFVRVQLETDDPDRSPTLHQVTCLTPGDDDLARLPVVYARADAEGGLLRRWLEAFRAELGDAELDIAELARRLDPKMAPASHLPWLASWIAYDLPARANTEEQRALLQDAHRLYRRRGTLGGLREMVRIYTGIECEITESFRSRQLWQLDAPKDLVCGLGLDTGLLPGLPDGMVVPGPSLPEPALQGLTAQYFFDANLTIPAFGSGLDFDADGTFASASRAPAVLTAAASNATAVVELPLGEFGAVWTGQIRAPSSGLFSFYLDHTGGARLYVDDQLLVDAWSPPSQRRAPRGFLPLVAERWYSVRIQYWTSGPRRSDRSVIWPTHFVELSWSAPGQAPTIVRSEALYSLPNDNLDPGAQRHGDGPDHLVVGETVLGAHGPLAAEDFGAPLFDDAAHHFTVRVQARDVRTSERLAALRAVLDAEKPAHTEYHLCVIAPVLRVGIQARVGIDAFVSALPPPGRYGEAQLGLDARLGIAPDHDDGTLRVEENLRIGPTAILR